MLFLDFSKAFCTKMSKKSQQQEAINGAHSLVPAVGYGLSLCQQ